jgi:eukaryotic-like serine/threonine-protein kinase
MNPADEREEKLFRNALQCPAGPARLAFLHRECADDPPLLRRLQALIQAHEQSDSFLEPPDQAKNGATIRLEPPSEEVLGAMIGRYKLLENVGEGGWGIVYVAEQTEPIRRRVALKVIKLGMDTRAVVARFEAERQALALMDHPNIAKVLDAGTTESGRPYFVMELVRGIKITDYCDQNHLSTRERLDLFIQVCHAIQHAHQKGIIHRDIKPSNILVTLHDGVPVPKVIDFGIAKATEGRLTDATVYTQLHQFMGTPAYMSPEQAEMSGLDIDTRSDIYSLGVLLYELLTGRTPFDPQALLAAGLEEMRRTIREKEPARPSTRLAALKGEELTTTAKRRSLDAPKLISLLKGDLDWIVMKCLEKDRGRRYETANGLAADIQRHLEHEPVVACPPCTAYRIQKFVRRNKLMVTAAAVAGAALLLGIVGSTWQAVRATRAERTQASLREAADKAREEEAAQQRLAVEARTIAEQQAYAANINLAYQAWQESNLGRVRRLLAQTKPKPGQEDLRGWEWRYLWGLAQGDDSRELARFGGGVWRLACSDNGGLIAVGLLGFAAEERGSYLYDLGPDRWSNRRRLATNSLAMAVFLPRSGRLLSNRLDDHGWPGISVLEASALREVTRIHTTNEVRLMRVSRDGRWLASLESDRTLRVWRTEDWNLRWSQCAGGDGLFDGGRIEFLDGDRRLAVGSADGLVDIFETATGEAVIEFLAHADGLSDEITALAYVPASHLLAIGAGYGGSKITLWNPETGELVRTLTNHLAHVPDLAVSPDGRWMASASADETVRLWDTKTWNCARTLHGHEDEVQCLAFSADSQHLISGDREGSVRLWQVPPPERMPALRVIHEPSGILRLSPDSKRMVTFSPGGQFVVWDMDTGEKIATLTALQGSQGLCQFSPDGRQLLVGGPTGKVRVWDFTRDSWVGDFDTGRKDETHPLMCIPGTNLILMEHLVPTTQTDFWGRYWSAGANRYYTLWDYQQRRLVSEFPHQGMSAKTCNLSSRGDFAMIHLDGSFSYRRIGTTGALTNFWPHRRGVRDVAFTPDGRTFATAGDDGLAKLWDAETCREIVALKGNLLSTVWALDISADGRRLATAGAGRRAVKVWDVQTHHELISLDFEGLGISRIEFSRDGNKLVGQNRQGHLHIWRAPSWEEIEAAEKSEAGSHQRNPR